MSIDQAKKRPAAKFWSLNGNYLIAEETETEDLHNDIGCILDGTKAIIQAVIDGMSDQGSQMQANPKDVVSLMYAAIYQVEMVVGLNAAAVAKCLEAERRPV